VCLAARCVFCVATSPWRCGHLQGSLSNDEHIAWVLLDTLLLGNHASPLIKTLIDSELGEDIIGGGCDDSLRQPT